jgi:hypothetical protein
MKRLACCFGVFVAVVVLAVGQEITIPVTDKGGGKTAVSLTTNAVYFVRLDNARGVSVIGDPSYVCYVGFNATSTNDFITRIGATNVVELPAGETWCCKREERWLNTLGLMLKGTTATGTVTWGAQ